MQTTIQTATQAATPATTQSTTQARNGAILAELARAQHRRAAAMDSLDRVRANALAELAEGEDALAQARARVALAVTAHGLHGAREAIRACLTLQGRWEDWADHWARHTLSAEQAASRARRKVVAAQAACYRAGLWPLD